MFGIWTAYRQLTQGHLDFSTSEGRQAAATMPGAAANSTFCRREPNTPAALLDFFVSAT